MEKKIKIKKDKKNKKYLKHKEKRKTAHLRKQKVVVEGNICVHSTFNNTIYSATDFQGNVFCWKSGGTSDFSGYRKSTPYAASFTAKEMVAKLAEFGLKKATVILSGPGIGKEACLGMFKFLELNVSRVFEKVSIVHNGCRLPKTRRI